jgi:hypothetical protein
MEQEAQKTRIAPLLESLSVSKTDARPEFAEFPRKSGAAVGPTICRLIAEAKGRLRPPVCRPEASEVAGAHFIFNEKGTVFQAVWQPDGGKWFCAGISPQALGEVEMGLRGWRWLGRTK